MNNVKQEVIINKYISLYIDTSDSQKIEVKVVVNGDVFSVSSPSTFMKSEVLLNLIDKAFNNAGTTILNVNKIYVNKGPGSFTGLRVGVAVANTLSFALQVPVNNLKQGEFEQPEY